MYNYLFLMLVILLAWKYLICPLDTWSLLSCSFAWKYLFCSSYWYLIILVLFLQEEAVWSHWTCSVTDHWTCSVTELCSVVSRKHFLFCSVPSLSLCSVFRPNLYSYTKLFILICIMCFDHLYQSQYYHVYILQLVLSCHLHLFLFSH